MNIKLLNWNKVLINFVLFALLVAVVVFTVHFYISEEIYIYSYDTSRSYNLTQDVVSAFRESNLSAIRLVLSSLSDQYNKLFCLPLIPFILILGDSRFAFILSCALVYMLPFSLVMGVIATRLIPAYPRIVLWSTAFLTLLIPTIWIPLLRGYPDIGAAVIIGLAILVYLKDIKLKERWQIPLIGFLLALSMLFRRHFAYSIRAFCVAIFLQGLILFFVEVRTRPRRGSLNLIHHAIITSLVVFSSLATLTILSPRFVFNVLTTDYRSLYSAWEKPISFTLQYYGLAYGWFIWLLIIIGFSAGILTRVLRHRDASFIIIFGSVSLIQWMFFGKSATLHHGTPFNIFVVLGLVSFIWTTWLVLKKRVSILTLSTLMLLLSSNAAFGLTTIGKFDGPLRPLFAASHTPLVWEQKDYDEISRLVEYLRNITSEEDGIYITPGDISNSLVGEAEKQFYGYENTKLKLIGTSNVDSRDIYPLQGLLNSQYVTVTPYESKQECEPESNAVLENSFKTTGCVQNVRKFVVDAFTDNWEFAQDFQRLTEQFNFRGKVITIYQRTHPTSQETIFKTIKMMQSRIKPTPGRQSDWILISRGDNSIISKNQNGTTGIYIKNIETPTSALYFNSLPKVINLTGDIRLLDNQCTGLSLHLMTLNQQGNVTNNKELNISYEDFVSAPLRQYRRADRVSDFSLSIQSQDAAYLYLDLVNYHNNDDDVNSCSMYIGNISIY